MDKVIKNLGKHKIRTPEGDYIERVVKRSKTGVNADAPIPMNEIYDWIQWENQKWQVMGMSDNTEADEPYIWKKRSNVK